MELIEIVEQLDKLKESRTIQVNIAYESNEDSVIESANEVIEKIDARMLELVNKIN